jgi:hypothetical protein
MIRSIATHAILSRFHVQPEAIHDHSDPESLRRNDLHVKRSGVILEKGLPAASDNQDIAFAREPSDNQAHHMHVTFERGTEGWHRW